MKIEITTKEIMNGEETGSLFFPSEWVNSLVCAVRELSICPTDIRYSAMSLSGTMVYCTAIIIGKDVIFDADMSNDGIWHITRRN